jgi:hypothetical protein
VKTKPDLEPWSGMVVVIDLEKLRGERATVEKGTGR